MDSQMLLLDEMFLIIYVGLCVHACVHIMCVCMMYVCIHVYDVFVGGGRMDGTVC